MLAEPLLKIDYGQYLLMLADELKVDEDEERIEETVSSF